VSVDPDVDSPILTLIREYEVEPTLDDWLEFNGAKDCLNAELLEVLTAEFCATSTSDACGTTMKWTADSSRGFASRTSIRAGR